MVDNIFIHDAVPTWSGFVYQGQIAVYLAVKKIYELDEMEKKEETNYYAIEMEKCEDIAVIYTKEDNKKYESIHQVKNYEKNGIGEYKSPLIQLMLEKGFCKKNGCNEPDAYLHVSKEISIKNGETFEDKMQEWKAEIINFYKSLCDLKIKLEHNEYEDVDEIFTKIKNCINKEPIKFNRAEYKDILNEVNEACKEDEKNDLYNVKIKLNKLLEFLENKLCVPEIDNDVSIYSYDNNNRSKKFCTGMEIFNYIVDYVTKYKSRKGIFCQEQYKYIADKMISLVERKILERHHLMQKKEDASSIIFLSEFVEILDQSIEKNEEEANFLELTRKYNEYMEEYCHSICENKEMCLEQNCRLQQEDIRRNLLDKETFVKLCYNLNPNCSKKLKDRSCLNKLLEENGMIDSVFASIKAIPEEYFIEQNDKSGFKIMNQGKSAFLTAISNGHISLVVKQIEKALRENQNMIINAFEADQLVTTQLEADSSIWDNSCVKIREDDLQGCENIDNNIENNRDKSIYVCKKPELIKAESLIRRIGENRNERVY